MKDDLDRRDKQHQGNDGNEEEKKEPYAFVQETIKTERPGRREMLRKGLRIVCCGFLFGVAAILGMALAEPAAERIKDSASGEISLRSDEETGDISVGEADVSDGSESSGGSDASDEEAEGGAAKTEDDQTPEEEEIQLNADTYKQIYAQLKSVRKNARMSLAYVRGYGASGDEDTLFASCGCILAINEEETLLVTAESPGRKATYFTVEFFGGEVCEAAVSAQYGTLELTVFSVASGEMKKTTKSIIKAAKLGSSSGVADGDPVLALGGVFGFSDSVGYGTVQDVTDDVQLADGMYRRILTDIQGADGGSGVLVNLQGDIIGLVSDAAALEEKEGVVSGVGITELKTILEFLLNGKKVPYIGVTGTDVTQETADEKEMPEGVYIQSVEADSPAMKSGVKSGDILTEVNGTPVATLNEYHRALMECTSGKTIQLKGMRLGKDGYVEMDFKVALE